MVYSGRGRRPIWCSARCRTEACIERRGNRLVGVEPRIVEVQRERTAPASPIAVRRAGSRRPIEEWVECLEDLRLALRYSAVYDRELQRLVEPLNAVFEAARRRLERR